MCPEYESNAQSFHMHFPPIENHYKEQFNVSGLLNEDSDMKKKKELLNHNWKNVAWPDDSRFLCNIQMIGSEFGVKNMKAWKALSQWFRLVV